jgi:hypothetical protein
MPCFILKLPNEVLMEIINIAGAWPDEAYAYKLADLYSTRWALTLVCRRLHSLSMPLLYSTLVLVNVVQRPGPDRVLGFRRWNSDSHSGNPFGCLDSNATLLNALLLLYCSVRDNKKSHATV